MGRNNRGRGRRGKGGWKTLEPDASEVLVAWANLVGAIVLTMREEDIGNAVIHGFLDHLDLANVALLNGDMLDFVTHVTTEFRALVPSND